MSVPATRNGNGSAPAVDNGSAMQVMADVITAGDLARLTPAQRVEYYGATCRSLGINPLTKPFDFINLNGKLTLYATKGATDQLRALRGISVRVVSQETEGDVLVVTVEGTDATGRTDTEIGAVSVTNLRGDNLANARMKALTKAKRRLTLSMVGLGMLDESEIGSVPNARPVNVDPETGEIIDAPQPQPEPRRQQPRPQQAPQPEPEPEPTPEPREELPVRWIIRLEELADALPVIESDRLVPADLKRVRMEVMRHVVRRVSGEDSRKYLTREQAEQVARELTTLKARLDNDGSGIDPTPIVGERRIDPETGEVSGGGRLPLVDAEPVEGEAGADRHTR